MNMEEIIESYVCNPCKVAVIGASQKQDRPVFGVMEYLKGQNFDLYPVNPSIAGEEVLGFLCYASISEVPENVDVVCLFISPKHQGPVLEEIKGLPYKPVVWMQPGAENDEAEKKLTAEGYSVVKGACIMMTHQVYCTDD